VKVAKAAVIAVAVAVLAGAGAVVYFFETLDLGAGDSAPATEGPPEELSDAARERLDAEGVALTPTLEQLRTGGDITPRAVVDALVAFGYPARDIDTVPLKRATDGGEWSVVFGVTFEDGCLSGVVTPTEVRATAMGEYPGSGCIPPDSYPRR
jgi:hypothetical protein